MSTGRQLLALMKSHLTGDEDNFYSIALQVAAHEAKKGHTKLAQDLKSLLDSSRNKNNESMRNRNLQPIPLAQPQGALASLVDFKYSETRLSSMVLEPEMEERLQRVLLEVRQQHRLLTHGLTPRRKLLLIGPPGSGKTMTASALAGELHLPLFTVLLDGLITKFMGETASKLRILFDAMSVTRGVYLFDEFDAIGARREERLDVGEIRRVLNSFLQFLEKDKSNSIIIAATNYPDLLDRALFRRFDDVIEYSFPEQEIVARLLRSRLAGFNTNGVNWTNIAKAAQGLSQAEISRAAEETAKRIVLADKEIIADEDLLEAVKERKNAAHR